MFLHLRLILLVFYIRWDWGALRADIAAHGVRNSLLVAPMPTASTSQARSTRALPASRLTCPLVGGHQPVLIATSVQRIEWSSPVVRRCWHCRNVWVCSGVLAAAHMQDSPKVLYAFRTDVRCGLIGVVEMLSSCRGKVCAHFA